MENKMKIPERLTNFIEKAKGLNRKQLETYRYSLFFIIIVDLIGIYYFLHLKKVGIVIMFVSLVALGFIMFLESKLPKEKVETKPDIQNKKEEVKKMNEMNETKESVQEEENESEDFGFGLGLGLPDADEFRKRAEQALGGW
jgi:hypothetical protein